MTSALITGGTGFIGLHLAKHLLSKKLNVTLVDNFFRGKKDIEVKKVLKNKNVKIVKCDLRDSKQLKKLIKHDYVFHLAAINGTKHFYEIPHEVLKTNILSTINILDWYSQNTGKKFLFSSSSETYAGTIEIKKAKVPTPENVPLTITDPFNPRWSYGGSKIAGELLTTNYGEKKGFDYTIVRYHNIYGPRMGFEHVIPEFCQRILGKKTPFVINGGKQSRAFCYVLDAVKATFISAKSKKTTSQIVNIGNSHEEITITELAKKLFKIAKVNPKIKIKKAPKGSVIRRCPNTKKLKKLTGFEAKVFLDHGLKNTFNWYKENFSDF